MESTNKLHKSLIYTSNAHRKVCRSYFAKLNLSDGQPKVLEALLEREGYLQKDLAQRCHVEPATMTIILGNMDKRGLIRRETAHVSGGKRAYAVYLTESGKAMAEEVEKIVDSVESECFLNFSEDEKKLFMELLDRAGKNLANMYNQAVSNQKNQGL